jgi:hypothetical protein
MRVARDLELGRKFKLGRIILSGTIFSRACPKWMNPTEFRPNSIESENRGCGWQAQVHGRVGVDVHA